MAHGKKCKQSKMGVSRSSCLDFSLFFCPRHRKSHYQHLLIIVHLAYQLTNTTKMLPTSLALCFCFFLLFNLYLLSLIAVLWLWLLLLLSANWFLFYFVVSTSRHYFFRSPFAVLNNNTEISTAKWFFVALHRAFGAADDDDDDGRRRMNEKKPESSSWSTTFERIA